MLPNNIRLHGWRGGCATGCRAVCSGFDSRTEQLFLGSINCCFGPGEASGAGGGAGSVGLLAMNATQVQCEPHDSVVLIKYEHRSAGGSWEEPVSAVRNTPLRRSQRLNSTLDS
ncbi:hypothetical protein SFRURICE_014248, partial [Spodoptera frugiperda]